MRPTYINIAIIVSLLGLLRSVHPLEGAEPEPIALTLHPMAAPVPALKYKLLPGYLDRIPGNAAVHYGKVTAEEISFFSNRGGWLDKLEVWRETPIAELRNNQVQMLNLGAIEDSLRRAARSEFCDWQLPIGDEPYYTTPLPEVQQSRLFGRIMATRARFQIVDGKFDEAVQTFQIGYALARNVATGETLINGLVGIAICGYMDKQLLDFVQQPTAPNLYWAITMLPSPMFDMQAGIEVDAFGVELSFPEMRNLESTERTPDEWRELFHRFAGQMHEWTADAWMADNERDEQKSPEELDEICEKMQPIAKLFLTMRGMPKGKVERMSVHQAALIYTMRLHHELLDEAIKYSSLPYPQAMKGIDEAIEHANSVKKSKREVLPLDVRSINVFRTVRTAAVRVDREIAFLRLLEALRLHAAETKAGLPAALADITEVPIPDDPVTGEPFDYRLDGDTAYVRSPDIGNTDPFHYAITMRLD